MANGILIQQSGLMIVKMLGMKKRDGNLLFLMSSWKVQVVSFIRRSLNNG